MYFYDSSFLKINPSFLSCKNWIHGIISSVWNPLFWPCQSWFEHEVFIICKNQLSSLSGYIKIFFYKSFPLYHILGNSLYELFIVPILQGSFFIKFDHNNSYYLSHGIFMSLLQCHYLERFQSRNIKDANQFP